MSNQTGNDDSGSTMFLFIAVFLIIFLALPAAYAAKAAWVNGLLLDLAKFQLRVFLPFSDEAQKAWAHISSLDPASLTWDQMSAILSYTGKWMRWPAAGLLAVLVGLAVFMGRTSGLTRRFNMESLLANNAEVFPCLAPIVGRGKFLLSPESYDIGLWRIGRTPLQFAAENGLLLNEQGEPFPVSDILRNGLGHKEMPAYGRARLDEDATRTLLRMQLTPSESAFSPSALTPLRKALAASFMAYAEGDKNGCIQFLNELSVAYVEKENVSACPLLDDAKFQESVSAMFMKHEGVLNEGAILMHSSYELPWFMALLTRARKKGVLATSQFLFVRPLDRPLWYALNQCGGRASWVEAVASWAHYQAEEKAGKTLSEPQIEGAVRSLARDLDAQGWLIASSESKADTPAPEPEDAEAFELVSVDAEPDAEADYDAHSDETLRDQLF